MCLLSSRRPPRGLLAGQAFGVFCVGGFDHLDDLIQIHASVGSSKRPVSTLSGWSEPAS
jgi:hypothetical protein